jgi:PRA1 family protein
MESSASSSTTSTAAEPTTATTMNVDVEALRLQLSSLVAKSKANVSLATLRPLPIFLGLREADGDEGVGLALSHDAFSPPLAGGRSGTVAMIKSRIRDNWSFFLSNYCLVAAMVALVVALMHLGMLLVLGILYGMWSFHGYLIKHEVVVFGIGVHTLLSVQQRFYVLFAISTVVILWEWFAPVVLFVMLSGVIILTHASLRDTTHLNEISQRGAHHMSRGIGGTTNSDGVGEDKVAEKDPLISKV